jgi:pimeloyl-ACP methyl ester carboxylesterase
VNGRISTAGVGRVVASEGDLTVSPKSYQPNNTVRGTMYMHAYGELAISRQDAYDLDTFADLYPTLAMDLGEVGVTPNGTDGWANNTVMSRITSGATYLQGTMGAKSGKLLLYGFSMGALATLAWAAHNPTKVAAVFVGIPTINLGDIWTNNTSGFTAAINTAYGGTYSPTATDGVYGGQVQAAHDVYYMSQNTPSLFTSFPIMMWYGSSDVTAQPSFVTAFASSVNTAGGNVTLVNSPTGTHSTTLGLLYNVSSNVTALSAFWAANA